MAKEEEERRRWRLEQAADRHLRISENCAKHARDSIDGDMKCMNRKEVLAWIKDAREHLHQAEAIMGEQ